MAAQAHPTFEEWTDAKSFEDNDITIVRLEAEWPLLLDHLNELQIGRAQVTNQIGRYSWTNFPNWRKALQYYQENHRRIYDGNLITATPVREPNLTYGQLMEYYYHESYRFHVNRRTITTQAPIM